MSDIYVAKATFHYRIDGHPAIVSVGQTVREGHPLLSEYRDMFVPLRVDFEHKEPAKKAQVVEQATAAPGEKRKAAPAPSKREAGDKE